MIAEQQTPQSESNESATSGSHQTTNATSGLCWCGCGASVPAKSFYRPGHDSRHVGQVAREVAESDAFHEITDHLPTKALQLKAWNMAYRIHQATEQKRHVEAKKAKKAKH